MSWWLSAFFYFFHEHTILLEHLDQKYPMLLNRIYFLQVPFQY